MKADLRTVETVVAIIGGAITILAALWKFALPLVRQAFKLQIVYAAQIAELSQFAPGVVIQTPLDKFVPIRRFPGYSDWSIQGPNLPPRANEDQRKWFATLDGALAGQTLEEANRWEQRCPAELTLLGNNRSREFKLFQTYLRLRWLLLSNGQPDYERVSSEVGVKCAEALRVIEAETQKQIDDLPTRALIIRVGNRTSRDAKDLTIDITSGGEIYDVTVDERKPDKMEKTAVRFSVTYQTLQPGQTVEVKVWYRWLAVEFGSRMFSQAESFPGREGILVNYIGISNGRVTPQPNLLSNLGAWRSIETKVGPERGFERF